MIPTPKQIRSFLAIARVGSFTRAAADVGLSQPALTVQMRQLEAMLGVRLFDRDKRQVHLTLAGKRLLAPLERVLTDLDAVMNSGRDIATVQRGKVVLAALPSLSASLLPYTLQEFRERHAGIDVQIHDVVGERILQMVRDEEVDFGVGTRPTPDRALTIDEFLVDRICAFFPEDFPLGNGRLTASKVVAHPLILTRSNSSVRILFERLVAREGVEIQIAAEANYMSTALGMVRAGLGVAILPESAAEAGSMAGLAYRPIRAPWHTRKIGIVRRRGSSLSPAANKFIEVLRKTAKERPPHHYFLAPMSGPPPA